MWFHLLPSRVKFRGSKERGRLADKQRLDLFDIGVAGRARSEAMAVGGSEESVGQRIRRLRLERGLSQRELQSPGVSYAYISRIEAGARTPSVRALRKIAPKLGVSADYLETGSDLSVAERLELRLRDAQLELRLGTDLPTTIEKLQAIRADCAAAGLERLCAQTNAMLGVAAQQQGRTREAVTTLEGAVASGFVSPESECGTRSSSATRSPTPES